MGETGEVSAESADFDVFGPILGRTAGKLELLLPVFFCLGRFLSPITILETIPLVSAI